MSETPLNIAVIGGGSGAFAAALKATERGAWVSMIESGTVGGTCVNVGCVPSKILLRAAETAWVRRKPAFAGMNGDARPVGHDALLAQVIARVSELREVKYRSILRREPGIEWLAGRARFVDARTLEVHMNGGDRRTLRPDRVLIAAGASPAVPPIPGLAGTPYWTSTEALFPQRAPGHLAVVGSSFVALELAQAWRRLGSKVTLLARGKLLSRKDPAIGTVLEKLFQDEGIDVRTHTPVETVEHTNDRFTLAAGGNRVEADRLLVATGRAPNISGLRLEAAGVATDNGAIRVDDRLRTSVPGVYAIGDCSTMPQLVYVAAAAGTRAAINMTGGDEPLDLSVVPSVVFTDPQVATVGLDELGAAAAGVATETRRLELSDVPRALVNFDTRGFIKIVAETGTGRILGVHALAHNAGELIQTAALAIRQRLTVSELAGELFPYLTMSEGLKLCAQTFSTDVSRLSCCAG